MKSYRTFIAVKTTPTPELLDLFDACKELLKEEAIKWVDEKNMHLTLKFLGETSENQIEEIKVILEKIGSHFNVFNFKLAGCGYFNSKRKPRVLYTGIQDIKVLSILVSELENLLFELGFEKEKREFKPHLTLGRIKFLKNKERFLNCIEKYKDVQFQQVLVLEIIFYQSILKSQRPVYIPLKKVKLNNSEYDS